MIQNLPFEPVSSFHDYQYYSVFYGEPFIFEDYIYYFDGRDARIIGYTKEGNPISKPHLKELFQYIISKYSARTISLECPKLIQAIGFKNKYHRELVSRPNAQCDFEILIRNEKYDTEILKKNTSRYLKKGFDIRSSSDCLTYEHLLLLEAYMKRWRKKSFYKSEFISSVYLLINRPTSKIINCYYNNELVGFTIISSIKKLGLFNNHITVNEVNGVSDMLYAAAIEDLQARNLNSISLGFSLNKGLFDFKQKWGGVLHWKGSYEILWYNTLKVPTYLWATRIVRN